MALSIHNVHVAVDGKNIVSGVDLTVNPGEIHVIMGPNGAGKSTFANALGGHPAYTITQGEVLLDGQQISTLPPDVRAKMGLFLSMQYIPEIAGVTIGNFLRVAYNTIHDAQVNPLAFHSILLTKVQELNLNPDFLKRSLGVGFSGGERKQLEVLQLSVLDPTYAILDETDSGLDVDALKVVGEGVKRFATAEKGVLLITHYSRLLDYVQPDVVHIMVHGTIVVSGDRSLAARVEAHGYEHIANGSHTIL